MDYRHATFEPIEMVAGAGGTFFAAPPPSRYAAGVCFVRILTTSDEVVVTTMPLLSAGLCRAAGLELR